VAGRRAVRVAAGADAIDANGLLGCTHGQAAEYDPIRETEYLVRATLAEAEDDDTLRRIASTFDRASAQIRMGLARPARAC
jgi:hypothetical protein